MPKECSSCKNGDTEFPDWAVYKVVKAPMEARKVHGNSLCENHADILLDDYPEAIIEEVSEWVMQIKNSDREG
jgi:hypothetical protein